MSTDQQTMLQPSLEEQFRQQAILQGILPPDAVPAYEHKVVVDALNASYAGKGVVGGAVEGAVKTGGLALIAAELTKRIAPLFMEKTTGDPKALEAALKALKGLSEADMANFSDAGKAALQNAQQIMDGKWSTKPKDVLNALKKVQETLTREMATHQGGMKEGIDEAVHYAGISSSWMKGMADGVRAVDDKNLLEPIAQAVEHAQSNIGAAAKGAVKASEQFDGFKDASALKDHIANAVEVVKDHIGGVQLNGKAKFALKAAVVVAVVYGAWEGINLALEAKKNHENLQMAARGMQSNLIDAANETLIAGSVIEQQNAALMEQQAQLQQAQSWAQQVRQAPAISGAFADRVPQTSRPLLPESSAGKSRAELLKEMQQGTPEHTGVALG
jgi:hypothetical protein